MNLLHIDSSIQGANSISRQISAAIVARLRQQTAGLDVVYRDLVAQPLAHFALDTLPVSHPMLAASGGDPTGSGNVESEAVLEEFLAADIVVVGAPMYNFSVPSQLRAWLDRILVPGRTFGYGAEGPVGLAGAKRLIVALSRGGLYGAGTPAAPAEHAETYLRTAFAAIGIDRPQIIVAEGVQMGPENRAAAIEGALHQAGELQAA